MSENDTTAGPTTSGSPSSADDAAAAPVRRRRRAASRPAGPPEAVVPEGEPTTTEAAPSAPPAKRATRKRTAKKVAAPVADPAAPASPVGDVVPDPGAQPAGPAEPAADPAAPVKSPRKRAARKSTAKKAAAAETAPVPADDAPPTTTEDTAPPDSAADDEPTAQDAPAAGAPTASAVPVPVLFQAPDLSAAPTRRRRAASRPAGPPQHVEEGSAPSPAEPATGPERPAAPPADAQEQEPEDSVEAAEDEDQDGDKGRRRRRRGGRGRRRRPEDSTEGEPTAEDADDDNGSAAGAAAQETSAEEPGEAPQDDESESASSRRRRRRRRRGGASDGEGEPGSDDPPNTVVKVRQPRRVEDEVTGLKGSTRLEAKRQRRREGRDSGRRKPIVTEAEFLARRESVERVMVVREREGRTQIGVLEDGVLVEHFVARKAQASMIGNVYLGKVQNVLPSMEAAFVDIGKGRNAVLYAGEVNWDAAGMEGQPRRIEVALKSGDPVLVQVTKDPVGNKGSRLTSQVSLPGRYLVYVPHGSMTGISRKLPDTERARLKKILKAVVPDEAGVIVRTAAEGASEDELRRDVERLQAQWEGIEKRSKAAAAPALLHGEPDLTIKVIRDVFNEDFARLVVAGDEAWETVEEYVNAVAPDLADRLEHWDDAQGDVFAQHRVDEQIAKAVERKVWLPSGGSLVIDRTEAMTVVDVNTGKFIGSGGNLEATVTKNNLEAAEEIVRQLRLRDVGGIIVIDFIDMVLESNRELVLRRLLECLGRDRTKHQVAEVTSLGLVQMTRKRVGQGLIEAFSEPCEHCGGRGVILHDEPVIRAVTGSDAGSKPATGGGAAGPGAGGRPEKQLSKREKAAAAADEKRRAEQAAAVAKVAAAARARHEAEDAAAALRAVEQPAEAPVATPPHGDVLAAAVPADGTADDGSTDAAAPQPREGFTEEPGHAPVTTPPHGDVLAAAVPADETPDAGGNAVAEQRPAPDAGSEAAEPPVKAPRRRRRATAPAQAPAAAAAGAGDRAAPPV